MFHVPAVFKMRLQYLCLSVHLLMNIATKYLLYIYIYGDADKSLARPRRKKANVCVKIKWREFPSAPCLARGGGFDDSSRLDVVEIAQVPDVLPSFFSFLIGLRTYQHPGIYTYIYI